MLSGTFSRGASPKKSRSKQGCAECSISFCMLGALSANPPVSVWLVCVWHLCPRSFSKGKPSYSRGDRQPLARKAPQEKKQQKRPLCKLFFRQNTVWGAFKEHARLSASSREHVSDCGRQSNNNGVQRELESHPKVRQQRPLKRGEKSL